jgi:geranylgeranyl pyrophosphate synthase
MAQAFTDTVGTFAPQEGSELRLGKRTIPVLHAIDTLHGFEREGFERDLAQASRGCSDSVERLVDRMKTTGSVRFALERVEVLRHRAARALPAKLVDLAIDHPLRNVLRQYSVV